MPTCASGADVSYYMQMEKPAGDEWYDIMTVRLKIE